MVIIMVVSSKKCRRSGGFTLIELMIVIAVVAILASVAYASYSDSIQKSRRADGKEALGRIAALQEQFYIQRAEYSDDITELGGDASLESNYTMSVVNDSISGTACAEGACFTATATAAGAQAGDTTCLVMTLDSLGRKQASDNNATDTTDICW